MHWIPYVVAYAGLAVFLLAVIARILMWAKMPMHVRWELYPVAHEGKRASHGGSYLEESEWWTKPRSSSLWGELKVMVPEILFLVALKEHNRKLWLRSLPFHFGLYLIIACTLVMMGAGLGALIWPSLVMGGFGSLLGHLVQVLGLVGMCLTIAGAAGLLHQRKTAPELKDTTTPADLFNLSAFVVVFGLALVHFLAVDRDFSKVAYFTANLVTFEMGPLLGGGFATFLTGLSIVLLSALVAYIPLTHMSHFVGKYFAYHAIRWNDTPNLRGGDQEQAIEGVLSQKIDWSAPHIRGEGRKSWVDVASEDQRKKDGA